MKNLSLNGIWKLNYCLEGAKNKKTIPATVPGNVEIDLMKAGELPDVFFGDNLFKAWQYDHYEWMYEIFFAVPKEFKGKRVELVFHGVDCIAKYRLNGRNIGASENMFIEHSFDVSRFLKYGQKNRLAVKLSSAVNYTRRYGYEPSQIRGNPRESLNLRKAAHSFGWDIMPRLISAGLWRPVELVAHDATEFTDINFITYHRDKTKGEIVLLYNFATDAVSLDGFELRIKGKCGASIFEWQGEATSTAGRIWIQIQDAKFWWPRGYGDPNLYEVTAQLVRDGKVVAEQVNMLGVRTVELVRTEITTPEEPGEFLFRINGEPIMCKGSNWVPLDALHSRDAGRYEKALELFKDLGCNILRCWGGNVYEDHQFYDLCDKYGIMVWQDFSMACGRYPQNPEFQEKLRAEAVSVVKKLRGHPCIVLWAGDNECDMLNYFDDPGDNLLTRRILPEVVNELDYRRPYLPSSPFYAPEMVKRGKKPNLAPEYHLWGPRDYFKSRYYTESPAHFASEIGYHGSPGISSIRKFIDKKHLWPGLDNQQWRIHSTDSSRKPGNCAYRVPLMFNQIKVLFDFTPDNLKDFTLASQISQAEAKKFFIEMFRLAKWRKTGIIWWNALDGWPQFSDAIVDYYFGKKLAYQYIKRVQQPICIMFGEPADSKCRVVAGNDTLCDAAGKYRIWDADSGETLMKGSFETKANQNAVIGEIAVKDGEQRLFLIEWELDGEKYGNHYVLGKIPLSFRQYKGWLKKIAGLPEQFDADKVAK